MSQPPRILLVEARCYTYIAAGLPRSAEPALTVTGASHESIAVPRALEIPAAIGAAARSAEHFDGFVALGCVIGGETTHYGHICAESARALGPRGRQRLAIGYGMLMVENEAQALVRASPDGRDKGGEAVRACLAIIELKRRLAGADP